MKWKKVSCRVVKHLLLLSQLIVTIKFCILLWNTYLTKVDSFTVCCSDSLFWTKRQKRRKGNMILACSCNLRHQQYYHIFALLYCYVVYLREGSWTSQGMSKKYLPHSSQRLLKAPSFLLPFLLSFLLFVLEFVLLFLLVLQSTIVMK